MDAPISSQVESYALASPYSEPVECRLHSLLRHGRPQSAQEGVDTCLRYLDGRPAWPALWGLLGAFYAQLGDDEQATYWLIRGMAEPYECVLHYLVLVHARQKRLSEAAFYVRALWFWRAENNPLPFCVWWQGLSEFLDTHK